MTSSISKVCSTCKEEKDASAFRAHKSTRDGLHCICKQCDYERQKRQKQEKYKNLPEKKQCNICETVLPQSSFYKEGSKDGLKDICKTCFHERRKAKAEEKRKSHTGEKICKHCNETLPVSAFAKNTQDDGYQSVCKPCNRKLSELKRQLAPSHKICKQCNTEKLLEEFYNSNSGDGKDAVCKECKSEFQKDWWRKNAERSRFYNAKKRAQKLKAMPVWEDEELIELVYAECPDGYQVDHIIPLQNDLVCGLHTISNLQYLSEQGNLKKSNFFTLD